MGGMHGRANNYINLSKYCITGDQCGDPNANCHLNVSLPMQTLHLSSNYYRMQAQNMMSEKKEMNLILPKEMVRRRFVDKKYSAYSMRERSMNDTTRTASDGSEMHMQQHQRL